MARNENPPFERGATIYNGGTIDTNDLAGVDHEGKIWEFEDIDISQSGCKPARSNRRVLCMAVRNVAAAALLPKRLATFQASGKNFLGRVDGYATITAKGPVCVIDEWLAAAGVPVNDMCWGVVDGPTEVLVDLAAGANNVFNVGDVVVALTAATSGATTAGRVAPQDLTGATAVLGVQVQNRLGYALSAKTTANTTTGLLIDMRKW